MLLKPRTPNNALVLDDDESTIQLLIDLSSLEGYVIYRLSNDRHIFETIKHEDAYAV